MSTPDTTSPTPDTIFDKIVRGDMSCYKVWEDDKHLAFLTPFPNTPGMTVVIPKHNPGDYVFDIDDTTYADLMLAVQKVARLLEKAFNVPRVALIFEGTGVAYVHAKLYPMHRSPDGQLAGESTETDFTPIYRGWLTTHEGPKMDDTELAAIQQKIVEAAA